MLRGICINVHNLNPPTLLTSSRGTRLPTCSARLVKLTKATSWKRPSETTRKLLRNQRLKNQISVLKDSNGNAVVDPASQSELISDCFATAYRPDNGSHPPPIYKESIPMESVQISNAAVKKILPSLNQHKSPGRHGLHPTVLKILAPFVAEPFAHLFNLSLSTGQVKFLEITVSLNLIVCEILKSFLQ